MVLPDSDEISRVSPYSGYCQVYILFQLRGYYSLQLTFPGNSSIKYKSTAQSYNHKRQVSWFAILPFRSPLLRKSRLLSLPVATQMFQFTTSCPVSAMYSHKQQQPLATGFPHSDTCGSKLTYSSPQNFVVSHVLHRLLVPRHPPCALINLTFKSIHLSIW